MNTKHTPGPWKVFYFESTHPAVGDTENGNHICQLWHFFNQEITDANARLIAAAPELLNALIEAERVLWMHSIEISKSGFNPLDAINKAKAAIKKATE